MKKRYKHIYQFKITLQNVRPSVWRRIQVPDTYTFWDLHIAIQDAMGWTNSHLHQFNILDASTGKLREIGIPEGYGDTVLSGWRYKIADYFSVENPKAKYIYDFGDNWTHIIILEKILPREKGIEYPLCIDGKRACPPEDCGGPWGYQDFLKVIKDPKHKQHKELMEWVGGEFDPEYFDPKDVVFEDPDEELKMVRY